MITKSKFKPAWWLKNPHLQTLWAAKVRKQSLIPHADKILELPDGDFVELVCSEDLSNPLICIFHGLEGSIESQYATGLFNHLNKAGYSVIFMHFRGCGHKPNKKLESYHSGKTDDIQFLLEYVIKQNLNLVGTIGISLGGNALLKYLGTNPTIKPNKNMAISAPLLINRCSDRLDRGFSKIYCKYLLGSLKIKTEYKKELFIENNIDFPDVSKINSFWQFDDLITAPIHQFKDAKEYYQKCSAQQYLKDINTDTLIIHAEDDPFMYKDIIPNESMLSDKVNFELAKHGGHVGYVEGFIPFKGKYWLDKRAVKYFDSN